MAKKLKDGDLMSLQEFEQGCKEKYLMDYDGFGQFCDENGENRELEWVYPSKYLTGKIISTKKYIIWFNR